MHIKCKQLGTNSQNSVLVNRVIRIWITVREYFIWTQLHIREHLNQEPGFRPRIHNSQFMHTLTRSIVNSPTLRFIIHNSHGPSSLIRSTVNPLPLPRIPQMLKIHILSRLPNLKFFNSVIHPYLRDILDPPLQIHWRSRRRQIWRIPPPPI